MCIFRSTTTPVSTVSNSFGTIEEYSENQAEATFLKNTALPRGAASLAHHVVLHSYHDHSHEVDEMMPNPVARGGVTTPFPIRLHEMLDVIDQDGLSDVVSWQPHGRCFVVHKMKDFADRVMPKYFNQSKFPSFQRQLNLYGFQRLTKGPDKGGYYHELFLRGRIFLSRRMNRTRVKGTGVRARSNPAREPNFYMMNSIHPIHPSCDDSSSGGKDHSSSAHTTPAVTQELGSLDGRLLDDCDCNFGLIDFGGMAFHLRDPEDHFYSGGGFQKEDTHGFLERVSISNQLYDEILKNVEDDRLFGDLLQQIIMDC